MEAWNLTGLSIFYFKKFFIDPHVTSFLIIGLSFKIKGILKEKADGLHSCEISKNFRDQYPDAPLVR